MKRIIPRSSVFVHVSRGGPVRPMLPMACGAPSAVAPQERDWDLLLTAETHNFPCAVAPYPGNHTAAFP